MKHTTLLVLFSALVAAVAGGQEAALAFPHCWGAPTVLTSDGDEKSAVKARIDSEGRVHVFWFDYADSLIMYARRDTTGTWDSPVELTESSASHTFGIAVDDDDELHLVWSLNTSLGAAGQTTNLYYKTTSGGSWTERDSICITPTYNDPDSVDTIAVEGFENGVPPNQWGRESDNTSGCYVLGGGDAFWGSWEATDEQGLPRGGTYCAMGRRFYGCEAGCHGSTCECYLVMPPFVISGGETLTFYYRVAADGDTVGLRVKVLPEYAFGFHLRFTDASTVDTLWEDPTITNDSYQKAEVAFPENLDGTIVFVAFELFSASTTSAGICIDDVYADVSGSARPKVPQNPAVCSKPGLFVDSSGDIHVAFERTVWQPDACCCRGQIYYVRRDASSGWGTPVYVDSSGVGERNPDKPRVYRLATDPAIAVDSEDDVHLTWKDVALMNDVSGGDDVYYSYHASTDEDWEWQDSPFVVSDDDSGRGAIDGSFCFKPDLVVDHDDNVHVVFHGTRTGWASRTTPGVPMMIWWRTKTSAGWSDTCKAVPDPDVDFEQLNCRDPRVELDSDGNMFVAYTFQDTVYGAGPWAMGFARRIVRDSSWVYPATIIGDLSTTRVVKRPPALMLDSAGDAHLAWTQNNQATGDWSIMYMKSLDWQTCVDGNSLSMEVADKYIRGLSPNEYAKNKDPGNKKNFVLTFSVRDTSGCPMPEFPSDMFSVAVSETCVNPTDVCYEFDEELECATPSWDPLVKFWCQERQDTLFVTESTDAQGQALFRENNVSGTARLTLTPVFGSLGIGEERIVWITNCDHYNDLGKVGGSDFTTFGIAYQRWSQQELENWTWDLAHSSEDDSCGTGNMKRPIFKVSGPDFSFFSAHYGSLFVDSVACEGE